MHVERIDIAIATSSGGACTAYSSVVTGRILSLTISGSLASGADLTITSEATGESIVTLTNTNSGTYFPRAQVHGPTGTGLTLDGTRTMNEPVVVANDRVKVVVAQGGTSVSGTVTILVG